MASLRRIVIVGAVSSGKTTLARELACITGAPHVELDSLRYRPGWVEVRDDTVRAKVVEIVGTDEWVMDGNYASGQDLIWLRAQLLVWLDFPLAVILWRLLRRTFRRLLTRSTFAAGTQEQVARLFGSQSILVWACRSHKTRRKRYEELLRQPRYSHLRVERFHSPRRVRAWLDSMRASMDAATVKSEY